MINQASYKKQEKLSLIQFLAEAPTFIVTLVSAIFTGTLLIYVDLFDSLSYVVRYALVIVLAKKLSQDLRFEYNYGIGKIEAITSLLCDSIVLFGMVLTMGLSVYSIYDPSEPSKALLAVIGLKLYDIFWDLAFFNEQRKIRKSHHSAIAETNYAAAYGALMFDVVAFVAMLAMWLLRDNPIGGYISPVVSILVAACLSIGCVKRIKASLDELTDKTLPEEQQLKLLNVLTRHYDSYTQFHSIDSRKDGDVIRIEICLAFEPNTTVEEVRRLQTQMQEEFSKEFGNCLVNIVMPNQ